jgi:P4 family phage/plasmid primase-like protien
MLPEKLRNENFRFIKIRKGDKRPIEIDWTNKNNYTFDDPKFVQWLEEGNNYGVVGGFGKLLIVDFDNKDFEEEYLPKLPETLTIQTGGGGKHLYYFIDDAHSFKLLDKHKNTLADIQGRGKQVVGAGSLHPSGEYYKVDRDLPIATITLKMLRIIFSKHIAREKDQLKNEWDGDKLVDKIKDRVSISSLLADYGYNTSTNPTSCKLGHGSKGGKCFSFSECDNLWNCFHCGAGGDVFSFVMEHENCDFIKAKQILIEKSGLVSVKKVTNFNEPNRFKEDVLTLFAAKKREDAIQLMVDHILDTKNIHTTRDDERAEMWIYIKGIYVPQGRTYLKEFCAEILGKAYTTHIVNQLITRVEVETYVNQKDFFINERVDFVPVKNGILDINTKELLPFSPVYRFFNKLPITFDSTMECPAIISFISQILKTESDVEVVQEMFGYLLYRNYSVEKAFMFHGNGRNGKSKLIELMKHFIGMENCANITLQSLDKDSFAMGELFNKMANLAADLPSSQLTETGNFKSLTGHDLISAPRKFLTRVHFVNYAKMIFSANELPDTLDATEAFFLRWVVIDFPYTFLSNKEMKTKTNLHNCKLADKSIIEKISNEEELSGLLNWSLLGLHRLLKNGDFSYAKGAEEVRRHWMRKSSSVVAFIQDCLDVEYGSLITAQDLNTAYWLYCREHKLDLESNKDLKEKIMKRLPVISKRVSSREGNPTCWEGIRFRISTGINKKLEELNQIKIYEEQVN